MGHPKAIGASARSWDGVWVRNSPAVALLGRSHAVVSEARHDRCFCGGIPSLQSFAGAGAAGKSTRPVDKTDRRVSQSWEVFGSHPARPANIVSPRTRARRRSPFCCDCPERPCHAVLPGRPLWRSRAVVPAGFGDLRKGARSAHVLFVNQIVGAPTTPAFCIAFFKSASSVDSVDTPRQ